MKQALTIINTGLRFEPNTYSLRCKMFESIYTIVPLVLTFLHSHFLRRLDFQVTETETCASLFEFRGAGNLPGFSLKLFRISRAADFRAFPLLRIEL